MNFRKIMSVIFVLMIIMSISAGAKTLEFTIDSSQLYVSDNGIAKEELDSAAYIENGRTMVPIRVISEHFGADVAWNGAEGKVTIKNGDVEITLTIDKAVATVNGAEKALDAPAVIINGRTMVPLRFISEALGKDVEYIGASSQILISDDVPISTINGEGVTAEDYKFFKLYVTDQEIPDEVLPQVLPYINAFAEEITIMADAAKKNGITVSNEDLKEVADSIMADKEGIYTETLTANAVKALTNYVYATSYVRTLEFDVSEEDIVADYKANYVNAKHILIMTKDADTGEPYTKEQKKVARETAEYILRRIERGDNFDDLIAEYGQDPGAAQYPDGYVFTRGEMVEPFENAVFSMKVNEISGIVESDFGYHIIKRISLPELSDYEKYSLMQQYNQEEYNKLVDTLREGADIKYNFTDAEIAEKIK